MSGMINKVKEAVTGHHKETTGLENEHGSQSGVHGPSSSIASSDHTSHTNPGVLSSTKPGIHGERDSGVGSTGISNNELTGQGQGVGGSHSGSVAHGDSLSPTNPGVLHSTKPGIHGLRDSGTGGSGLSNQDLMRDEGMGSGLTSSDRSGLNSSNTARGTGLGRSHETGPQYTGTTKRDEGLIGSGVDNTGTGSGITGSDTRDSRNVGHGVGGIGSGLTGNRSEYDSGTTRDPSGLTSGTTGSGLTGHRSDHGSGLTGGSSATGLTGDRSDYDSGAAGSSGTGLTGGSSGTGLTGGDRSGYGSGNTGTSSGTGLTGGDRSGGYGSAVTGGSSSGLGDTSTRSGLTGSHTGHGTATHTGGSDGLVEKAERYVEGSEKHHRGDGHPEDIVHPGPHVTGTANKLDPHVN